MEYITLAEFQEAHDKIRPFLNATKLSVHEDNVYLKRESEQKTGSFKWSGVLYSVMMAFERLLEHKTIPYYLVTQSTGNHGIAVIAAVKHMVEYYLKKHPSNSEVWLNVAPGIFANHLIKDNKLQKMQAELSEFAYNDKGFVDNSFRDYRYALIARTEFLKKNKGEYLNHGGKTIMTGYGSIAFAIDEQVSRDKTIALYTTIGAGGPLGICLCLSKLRQTEIVISQTKEYDAFVRTLNSNDIQENDLSAISSVSDGIAVNCPEEYAVEIGRKIINKAITVSTSEVERIVRETGLGGSSCIALAALGQYRSSADCIVVLDCEGNTE